MEASAFRPLQRFTFNSPVCPKFQTDSLLLAKEYSDKDFCKVI